MNSIFFRKMIFRWLSKNAFFFLHPVLYVFAFNIVILFYMSGNFVKSHGVWFKHIRENCTIRVWYSFRYICSKYYISANSNIPGKFSEGINQYAFILCRELLYSTSRSLWTRFLWTFAFYEPFLHPLWVFMLKLITSVFINFRFLWTFLLVPWGFVKSDFNCIKRVVIHVSKQRCYQVLYIDIS